MISCSDSRDTRSCTFINFHNLPTTLLSVSTPMNKDAQASTNASQSTNEYDTGVSNGDVDWLFRGKSKKLIKKMNNHHKEEEGGTTIKVSPPASNPTVPSIPATTIKVTPPGGSSSTLATTSPSLPSNPPAPSNHIAAPSISPAASNTPPTTKKPSTGSPVISPTSSSLNAEKQSKLEKFRFGRTRSVSTSNVPPEVTSPSTTRRSSLNILNPSLTSDLASNDSDVTRASIPSSALSNISRLNSNTGKTRSLFSSISSKFKSPGPPSSSTQLLSSSPKSTPAKLHPTLMGVSGDHRPHGSQDLASLVNKPPAGSGMNIPRKGSHLASPKNSIESDQVDNSYNTNTSEFSSSPSSSGKFFRRRSSVLPYERQQVPKITSTRVILNKNPNRERIPLRELETVKLRRVNFAIDKLVYDPQQQIPLRRPKKGNVLIPEDIIATPPRLSQGISTSDGARVGSSTDKYSEKDLNLAIEAQKRALIEAEKHANEAHLAAKRIAHEVSQFKSTKSSKLDGSLFELENDDEEAEEASANSLAHDMHQVEIDKPLHLHENHFQEDEDDGDEGANELSLSALYTRCCHLREILPIPATLKQLKSKTKPLQVLKLLNPKPTLIDVLSFSDFIAITPINTIIFDNVTISTEMLKHFLGALVYNKSIEKLSLRNVAIDDIGWKYLCKFLSRNQTIKKLDISQQRIKADTKPNCIRSSMNWALFIKCLVLRGGIEELVINGCKLTDSIFKELIENAVSLTTYRLGIANTELNVFKSQIVANWIIQRDSKCVGVDVAFNDLNQGQLVPFINAFNKGNARLLFFSLHSTNLTDSEETVELLKSLTKIETLRFLDLSSLPQLFPGIISHLSKYLPLYPNLKRIHFDLNELSGQSIRAIAEILPRIQGLLHVSFLGNRDLNHATAGTLYTAVKLSKSIFTLDLDYDLVADEISQRIAFYLMRNMDMSMNKEITSSHNGEGENEEDLMFDGSLLMETAEKLLIENDKHYDKKEDIKMQNIITNALIERTRAVRKDIHRSIDTLFEKRNQGTLSLEGKETLLRFCLLDSSLEKLVHMFEEQAKNIGFTPSENEVKEALARPSESKLLNSPNLPAGSVPSISLTVHDNLHESSNELITAGPILSPHNTENFNQNQGYFPGLDQAFQPHQVVIESSDGKNVPVDNLTGRPVLMRSISQTSAHAKEQEQEEGEFHRWGFFIQQRSNSENTITGTETEPTGSDKDDRKEKIDKDQEVQNLVNNPDRSKSRDIPILNVLPSGSELRDAIIAAKGIESVTDLIDKINNNRVSIDKIYSLTKPGHEIGEHNEGNFSSSDHHDDTSDDKSIDSFDPGHEGSENREVNAVVDEAYDKLLNDAQRVRLNKQE